MSIYLKRLVSGNKARYRDDNLHIELDLAYVTDRIIVMGFPAVGVEGIYRNRRADVQRFLTARHDSDFWVFNLCPVRENAYDDSVFEGRVSRYPFPDHHVPPFLYFPLVTREMHAWLSGSDTRVAVLHCKAGKGRSGTLACAYLLFLYTASPASMPAPLHDTVSEWSLIGDKEGLQTPTADTSTTPTNSYSPPIRSGVDLSRVTSEPAAITLEQVLDLHRSRRMKHPRHSKHKMGVSIPSQQRWLSYWSHILARKGPPSLQPFPTNADLKETLPDTEPRSTKVKLTKLTVRMREPFRMQPHLVQVASAVITSAGKGQNPALTQSTTGNLWASLARYSDRLVNELAHRETESRSSAGAARTSPFTNDRWDRAKMIYSFAQMAVSDIQSTPEGESRKPLLTYVLRPLDEAEPDWVKLRQPTPRLNHDNSPQSEDSSRAFASLLVEEDELEDASGILLDADRELRIKLFAGEITLGWVWLIPAFHMSPDSPSFSLVLSNDDIDFSIGIGKAVVDMKISFACFKCEEGS